MRATILTCAFCALSVLQSIQAASCERDTLTTVSSDGDILVMLSGAVYEVGGGDEIDSMLWLPPESVLICEKAVTYQGKTIILTEIINLDERGEKVSATRLR